MTKQLIESYHGNGICACSYIRRNQLPQHHHVYSRPSLSSQCDNAAVKSGLLITCTSLLLVLGSCRGPQYTRHYVPHAANPCGWGSQRKPLSPQVTQGFRIGSYSAFGLSCQEPSLKGPLPQHISAPTAFMCRHTSRQTWKHCAYQGAVCRQQVPEEATPSLVGN